MRNRVVVVTASQALSSASNFLLIYFVARWTSLEQLGSLALAVLIFGLGTALVRSGLFRVPLVDGSLDLVASSTSAAFVVGVGISTVQLFAALGASEGRACLLYTSPSPRD